MSQDRALLRLSFLVQYVHCYTCVFCCRNTELEKQKVNNLVYFAPPCIHTMNRRNLAIINASLTRNRRITTKGTPNTLVTGCDQSYTCYSHFFSNTRQNCFCLLRTNRIHNNTTKTSRYTARYGLHG